MGNGEDPFKVTAVVMLVTHVAAIIFTGMLSVAAVPAWVARGVIIAVSARMFFTRDGDNSVYQEAVMICCILVAAADFFWAWAWVDTSVEDSSMSEVWVWALPQVAAACVSIYAAKIHTPSNLLQSRRHFSAFLLLVTHGVCFFFGASFYPGFHWFIYLAAVLVSWRLYTSKVEDEHRLCGALAVISCFILAAADVYVVYWCITAMTPQKWILAFPHAGAATASFYSAGALIRDRCTLVSMLVTTSSV